MIKNAIFLFSGVQWIDIQGGKVDKKQAGDAGVGGARAKKYSSKQKKTEHS